MVSTTPCYLKAVSLGQLLVHGRQAECTFQGQGRGEELPMPGSIGGQRPLHDLLQQLDHLVVLFNFSRSYYMFSTAPVAFYIPMNSAQVFQFLHILANTCYFKFFPRKHPNGCEVVSHCDFDLHFLKDSWCWTSLYELVEHLCIFFREMSIWVLYF